MLGLTHPVVRGLFLFVILGATVGCQGKFPRVGEPSRSFSVRYVSTVTDLTPGAEFAMWVPVPHDDPYQAVGKIRVDAPVEWRIETGSTYGNTMLYLGGVAPAESFDVTVEYDVDRYRYVTAAAGSAPVAAQPTTGRVDEVYLQPSSLCVVNDDVRKMARELAPADASPLEKARAFYGHVAEQMSYGKPTDLPWGRGDTMYACDARIGNCTDFHSYFISLCLAEGIPARFQIGIFGAYEEKAEEYKTGGYHCWAEFHDPDLGWVPVDISEADKISHDDPTRRYEYFGMHTDNRVTLSTGRDLILSPRQQGAPLNYFVYPYVEVDGRPHAGATKVSYWRERTDTEEEPNRAARSSGY